VKITASFQLPPGLAVLTPWPEVQPGRYSVPENTLRWRTMLALGRFHLERVESHGATLDIAVLDHPHHATRAGLHRPFAMFLLGAEAKDAALPGEWTAVHELDDSAPLARVRRAITSPRAPR
jgi:hypothetical protein